MTRGYGRLRIRICTRWRAGLSARAVNRIRLRATVGCEVEFRKDGFYLNGRRRFLRGILDQGYFPKGWYTPPSEEELIRDIELTLELGFNLSRKHQKVEDPRFYYWADRLGLLV